MATDSDNQAEAERSTLEALAAAQQPAPWVNRFRVMVGNGFARLTFLEESPEGVGTIARAAITMGIDDVRALSTAITNVLVEAEAKAAANANNG